MKIDIKEALLLEKLVTDTLKGNRRAAIELYMFAPFLFKQGTRTYTVLEPFLYNANEMR